MRKQVTFEGGGKTAMETARADFETPRGENRHTPRSRHVPTPKMSGRKKALFGTESRHSARYLEEDADLGPMSPLKFSNSPKRGPMQAVNITSFRNILGNVSPDSDRSLSPDFERRFCHSERYEILPASHDKENQIMDEETRLSFSGGTPRMRTPAEIALLDESNSNSLSKLMSSDLNIADKRAHVLKTPGLSNASNDQKKEPKTSFRKLSSQEEPSTPSDAKNPNPFKEQSSERKARTSLSFNDIRPISTKSFYSSSNASEETYKPAPKTTPPTHQVSYGGRLPPKRAPSNQRKRSSSKKRTNSIRLGNFNRGVFHKIKKPSAAKAKAAVKKLSTSQILESTVSMLDRSVEKKQPPKSQSKSAPSSPQHKVTPQLRQQLNRIKQIFQNSKNPIAQARPLSLSKSMTSLTNIGSTKFDSKHSDSETDCEDLQNDNDDDGSELSDNDDAKSEGGGRKFFKSSSSKRIRREYQVVNGVSATVRKGGKISLNQNKQKKRKYKSMFEEEFDFESEQLEVDDIISKLIGSQVESQPLLESPCPKQNSLNHASYIEQPQQTLQQTSTPKATVQVEIIDALQNEISNDEPIPVQSNVIFVDRLSPLFNSNSEDSNSREVLSNEDSCMQTDCHEASMSDGLGEQLMEKPQTQTEKFFPIFYKDHQRTVVESQLAQPCYSLFDSVRKRPKRLRTWRAIGSNQYQIDAGQKEYGAQQCPECGLLYTVHEPEEELIHENYHNSLHILKFAGWVNEAVVSHVPEWDVTGRVLAVGLNDGRHKMQKVQEILTVVDSELGYVEPCQLVAGSVVYLAVARSTILGICVVQPLQHANRLLTIEGIEGSIDCCTVETYAAKCGISRIWVSPCFRGNGIARTLLSVMKSHFVFGYSMSYDEIAFSAPTEAGKRLAESVTGRKDFLIYM